MIQKTLKKANRYDDVVKILNKIANDNAPKYETEPYADEDGNIRLETDGWLVRQGAQTVLDIITTGNVPETIYPIRHVSQYVKKQANVYLRNYAIQASYGREPITDMNGIRAWLILNSLICHVMQKTETSGWEIPDEWKKETKRNHKCS